MYYNNNNNNNFLLYKNNAVIKSVLLNLNMMQLTVSETWMAENMPLS